MRERPQPDAGSDDCPWQTATVVLNRLKAAFGATKVTRYPFRGQPRPVAERDEIGAGAKAAGVHEGNYNRSLFVRNVHLGIAAACGGVNCRDNSIYVAMHGRPLRIAKYNDGNPTAFEVLLVLDVFVRG